MEVFILAPKIKQDEDHTYTDSHTDPRFKQNNILKIHDLYQFQNELFVHDYKNNTHLLKPILLSVTERKHIFRQIPQTKFSSIQNFTYSLTVVIVS